ncbi:unnamed protein product [Tilletia controversa]|nr:unnamed protein product [Tilletia controversa]
MVPSIYQSTRSPSTPVKTSITEHSSASLGFLSNEGRMHPDLFEDLQRSADTEFYLNHHALDEVSFDRKSIDPRQLFFAGCNNPGSPLATSSMFANRGVVLASTPSSPPDTPKAQALDLPSQEKASIMRGHSAVERKSSASLNVTFAPSPQNSRPKRPTKTSSSQQATTPSALKANSKGKIRSSTNVASRSASAPAPSSPKARLQLPLTLPAPNFAPMKTDPHLDVVEHLHRVGLHADANNAHTSGWTAEYAIPHIRRMVGEGDMWKLALRTNEDAVDPKAFVTAAAQSNTITLQCQPADLLASSSSSSQPPTHVLAVVPSSTNLDKTVATALNKLNADTKAMMHREDPTLFPIHALLYALQCRSLPDDCFHPSKDPQGSDASGERTVRVIQFTVPKPSTFGITHDYICTGSSQRLLNSLVPLKYINDSLKQRQAAARDEENTPRVGQPGITNSSSKNSNASTLTPQAQAIQALADLSDKQLLHLLGVIQSVYANGGSLGLVDATYWKTLAAAWELVVGGLVIRRGRRADAELKAVRRALGGLGLEGSRQ